jgi:hypothetical protein
VQPGGSLLGQPAGHDGHNCYGRSWMRVEGAGELEIEDGRGDWRERAKDEEDLVDQVRGQNSFRCWVVQASTQLAHPGGWKRWRQYSQKGRPQAVGRAFGANTDRTPTVPVRRAPKRGDFETGRRARGPELSLRADGLPLVSEQSRCNCSELTWFPSSSPASGLVPVGVSMTLSPRPPDPRDMDQVVVHHLRAPPVATRPRRVLYGVPVRVRRTPRVGSTRVSRWAQSGVSTPAALAIDVNGGQRGAGTALN